MSFFDLPAGSKYGIKSLSLKVGIATSMKMGIATSMKMGNHLLPLKMNNILNR